MTWGEGLQLLNLLILPAMGYIIKLEKRIFTLETVLAVKLENLPCAKLGRCVVGQ